MLMRDAVVGSRVVSTVVIDIFPLHIWEAGIVGTVRGIERVGGQLMAEVLLDEHFPCLDEWENCLQVWEHWDDSNSDANMASFELLESV